MIFINKVIQILKVLYPNRIEPDDFFEVYENVIPQIQKLIDGVALGYPSEKLIENTLQPVQHHTLDNIIPESVPDKQEIQIDESTTCIPTFEEELKHDVDDS